MDEIPSRSNITCHYHHYSSVDNGPQVRTKKLSTRERQALQQESTARRREDEEDSPHVWNPSVCGCSAKHCPQRLRTGGSRSMSDACDRLVMSATGEQVDGAAG